MFIKCLQLEKTLADLRLPEQPLAQQEMLRSRLLAVPSGKRLTQLMRSNDLGSIMHKMAAIEEAEDIIECITKSVERQDYYRLMKIQDECGQTALHVAARNNHLLAVVCMLEHLLPDDRVRILEMRDTGHLTAFYHLAKDELNCDWIILNLLPLIEVQYLEKFFEVQLYTNQELSVTMIETLSAYRESLIITPPPGWMPFTFGKKFPASPCLQCSIVVVMTLNADKPKLFASCYFSFSSVYIPCMLLKVQAIRTTKI